MIKLKPLPTNSDGSLCREFTANGKTYKIRGFDEVLTIRRMDEMQKIQIILGTNSSFEEIFSKLKGCEKTLSDVALGKVLYTEMALQLRAIIDATVERSTRRYSMAMYLCTLFIVKDGEDITTWSESEANEKIEDWNKEGYKPTDFFLLAMNTSKGLKDILGKMTPESESAPTT